MGGGALRCQQDPDSPANRKGSRRRPGGGGVPWRRATGGARTPVRRAPWAPGAAARRQINGLNDCKTAGRAAKPRSVTARQPPEGRETLSTIYHGGPGGPGRPSGGSPRTPRHVEALCLQCVDAGRRQAPPGTPPSLRAGLGALLLGPSASPCPRSLQPLPRPGAALVGSDRPQMPSCPPSRSLKPPSPSKGRGREGPLRQTRSSVPVLARPPGVLMGDKPKGGLANLPSLQQQRPRAFKSSWVLVRWPSGACPTGSPPRVGGASASEEGFPACGLQPSVQEGLFHAGAPRSPLLRQCASAWALSERCHLLGVVRHCTGPTGAAGVLCLRPTSGRPRGGASTPRSGTERTPARREGATGAGTPGPESSPAVAADASRGGCWPSAAW